jgi:uncharacterized membrane protein YgcG
MPRILCSLLLLLLAAAPAAARSLSWDLLAVRARLDADGRLHVLERQDYVFSGDWNGGERTFRLGPGQRLDFFGITRIDAGSGERTLVLQGPLAHLNRYAFDRDGTRLRWRSRLPTDPEYRGARIGFELDYTLSGILLPQPDSSFLLDHDFAFPDRPGPIRRFVLDLQLDPAWRPRDPLPQHLERGELPPGEGMVLTARLDHAGPARPAAVLFGAPPWLRTLLPSALLFLLAARGVSLYRRERALGKFDPLLPPEAVTRSWVEHHILCHPPEVVGAAWDDTTAAPEVAALLARLVQEGKLASRVEVKRRWLMRRTVLHLERKAPFEAFTGDERPLVRALFVGSADRTDTESLRRHYRQTGFDPAAKIRGALTARVEGLVREVRTRPRREWLPTLLLFLAGLGATGAGVLRRPFEFAPTLAALAAGFALFVLTAFAGYAYQRAITAPRRRFALFHLGLLALPAALAWRLLHASPPIGTPIAAGLALVAAALGNSLLNNARTVQSPERLRLRRTLAAGRAFMRRELQKAHPHLDDGWYPYLLAYGLGPQIDRWFRAFGAAAASSPQHHHSSSSPSGSTGAPSFTGGGGAFGGAGASGGWAAAVGAVAGGVAAPGSSGGSGGGGGGGGGGSSGGGGGGGW